MKNKLREFFWMFVAGLMTLGVSLSLQSCATSGTLAHLGEQIAVQWAVMKVVEQNPEHAPRIIEIAGIVRAAVAKDMTATVATIYALIESKIDRSKLKPSDKFLVDSLLTAMQVALNERVGNKPGMLPVDRALAISEVAKWIEDGARSAVVP